MKKFFVLAVMMMAVVVGYAQEPDEITVQGVYRSIIKVTNDSIDAECPDDDIVKEYKNTIIVDIDENHQADAEKEKVYEVVEQMPVFPGGDAELFKYISQHIQYPADCIDECIQGRVIVNAVIQKDGTVGDVKVKRGKHPSLNAEAVRVIKALPKFKPGMMNGQAVNVYYLIPINFKLP